MAAFEADQRSEVDPAKSHARSPTRKVHRVISGIASFDQLTHPALWVIVEPDETTPTLEARMVE